jgi:hypothetical protein
MTLRERYDRAHDKAAIHFRIAEEASDELMGVIGLNMKKERVEYLEDKIARHSDDCAIWSNTAAQLRARLVNSGEMEPVTLRVNS